MGFSEEFIDESILIIVDRLSKIFLHREEKLTQHEISVRLVLRMGEGSYRYQTVTLPVTG